MMKPVFRVWKDDVYQKAYIVQAFDPLRSFYYGPLFAFDSEDELDSDALLSTVDVIKLLSDHTSPLGLFMKAYI